MRIVFLLLLCIPLMAACSGTINEVSKAVLESHHENEYENLIDDEKWEEAIREIDEVLKEKPKDVPALTSRSKCYYQLDNFSLALKDANEVIKLDPKSEAGWDVKACCYRDQGDFKKAIECFSEEIKLNPKNAETYIARAHMYDELLEAEKSTADYNKAIELDSENAVAYRDRGWHYLNIHEYKKAIEDCEESIQKDDTDIGAYLNRATAFMRLGTFAQAMKDFDKALEIDPTYYSAYLYKGSVLLFQRDLPGAVKEFEMARDRTNSANAAWGDLFLYLTYRWDHKDQQAAGALADARARSISGDWPYALVLYLEKKLTRKDLDLLAVSLSEKTEARTWAGFEKLLSGDKSGQEDLDWVEEHGDPNDTEYELIAFAKRNKDFLRPASTVKSK